MLCITTGNNHSGICCRVFLFSFKYLAIILSLFNSLLFSLYPQSVSLSLRNHILYTIGSQSNLMHRYSLIKLICRDSLFQSVLDSFMPPIPQHTSVHTLAQYILVPPLSFSLAALQSTEMPRSSQNATPNYFPISLKQLLPIQCNRPLIGDNKQRRLDNKQSRMFRNDDLGVGQTVTGPCSRTSFLYRN